MSSTIDLSRGRLREHRLRSNPVVTETKQLLENMLQGRANATAIERLFERVSGKIATSPPGQPQSQ